MDFHPELARTQHLVSAQRGLGQHSPKTFTPAFAPQTPSDNRERQSTTGGGFFSTDKTSRKQTRGKNRRFVTNNGWMSQLGEVPARLQSTKLLPLKKETVVTGRLVLVCSCDAVQIFQTSRRRWSTPPPRSGLKKSASSVQDGSNFYHVPLVEFLTLFEQPQHVRVAHTVTSRRGAHKIMRLFIRWLRRTQHNKQVFPHDVVEVWLSVQEGALATHTTRCGASLAA